MLPGKAVGPNAMDRNSSGSPASTQYPSDVPRSISGSPIVVISQSRTATIRVRSSGSSSRLSNL